MSGQVLSAEVNIQVNAATAALGNLSKKTKSASDSLTKDLGKVAIASTKLGDTIDRRLNPAANRATQTFTNVGRIMQDAAFGPIAIANNIEPLILSMKELGAAGGGLRGALSALGSSLLGPGGLLLGFSAVTFAMSGGIDTLKQYIPGIKEIAKAEKEAADAAKAYVDAQIETAISIQKQRIETEQLVKVARGDIGSKAEQKAALDQLNKDIPDYIGVLTEANIKTAEGAKIIGEYTRALEKQATAELLVGRAAELNVRKIDARNQFTEGQNKILKEQADLVAQITQTRGKQRNLIGSGADLQAGALDALGGRLIDLKTKYKDNAQAFIQSIGDINKELEKLRKDIDENTVVLDTSGDAKPKKLKAAIEQEISSFDKFLATPEITVLPSGIEIKEGLKKINSFIQQDINTELATKTFTAPAQIVIKPAFDDKELKKLLNQLNNILASGIEGAFTSIGQGLGDALANGTDAIKSLAKGFLNAFSGLITSIGEALIKYGIVKTGLDKIIKGGIALPGITAIGVGLAAVALGQLVKTAIPKFATGGIVTGPTVGMIGEGGQPEVILPLSKINQFLDGGQGGGGALTLNVSADVFQFALARNSRKQSRLY